MPGTTALVARLSWAASAGLSPELVHGLLRSARVFMGKQSFPHPVLWETSVLA